jgi:hypothetical protein
LRGVAAQNFSLLRTLRCEYNETTRPLCYAVGDGHTYLALLLWTSRVHRYRWRETIFCSMRLVDRDFGEFSCRHAKPVGKLRRDFKYSALLCSAVPFIPSIERIRLLAFALLSVVWVLGRFLQALCRGRLPHGLDFWKHPASSHASQSHEMQHSLRVVTADALTTLQQGLLLEISKSLPPSLSPRSLSHIAMMRSDGHAQSNGGGH